MLFCSAWECTYCSLAEGSAPCLRKQARRCESLSTKVSTRGLHEALTELFLELTDQASAIEKDRGALSAAGDRVSALPVKS
jgi:hypothetical protein